MPISLGAGAVALWVTLAGFNPVMRDVVPTHMDALAQSVVTQYLSTLPAPSTLPVPLIQSILFFLNRKATPLTLEATVAS